jgi:5-methylcytosine-specific restriction endonuclease McrA
LTATGFYHSPRWRALRLVALRRDRWRCTICGVSVSAKGQARVDHIHPRTTHPHLELALDNLRTLCPRCDNQGHREKGSHSARREVRFNAFNASGMPLDPNHHWRNG